MADTLQVVSQIRHRVVDGAAQQILAVVKFGEAHLFSLDCCCVSPDTVRGMIRRWETDGLSGLWEAPGRGAKRKWQSADLQYLEQCLEQEPRTYNSAQLAQKLVQERQVHLSAEPILLG